MKMNKIYDNEKTDVLTYLVKTECFFALITCRDVSLCQVVLTFPAMCNLFGIIS